MYEVEIEYDGDERPHLDDAIIEIGGRDPDGMGYFFTQPPDYSVEHAIREIAKKIERKLNDLATTSGAPLRVYVGRIDEAKVNALVAEIESARAGQR